MLALALLTLIGPAQAAEVPLEMTHQGRLMDSAGVPLDGLHDLDLKLYDTPSGGTPVWEESFSNLVFDGGFYDITFGQTGGNELSAGLFDGGEVYVGLAVDAGPELTPRPPLVSVPYAIVADTAANLDGGTVNATEVSVNGTTVIDSSGNIDWGAVSGAPSGITDLAGLGCADGEVMLYASGAWTCGVSNAHLHNAADISAGTIDIARLPVGIGTTDVAAGDHGHTAADVGALPSGTTAVDIGGLASTTTAVDIGGLADTTTAADIGALPDSGGQLTGDLHLTRTGTATAFDDTYPSHSIRFEASTWDSDASPTNGSFYVRAKGLDCTVAGECLGISPDVGPRAFEIMGSTPGGAMDESIIEIRDGYNQDDHTTIFHGEVIFEGDVTVQGNADHQGLDTYNAFGTYGQILAQAACTGMAPAGQIRAIYRTCSGSAPDCSAVCAAESRTCFNSLHLYANAPAGSVGVSGLRTHRYDSCGGGCGPNYCCCR